MDLETVSDESIDSALQREIETERQRGEAVVETFKRWWAQDSEANSAQQLLGPGKPMPLFDNTGVTLSCLAKIHAIGTRLADAWESVDEDDETSCSVMVKIAREAISEMLEFGVQSSEMAADIGERNPHQQTSISTFAALDSLTIFARELSGECGWPVLEVPYGLYECAIEMLRYEHVSEVLTRFSEFTSKAA